MFGLIPSAKKTEFQKLENDMTDLQNSKRGAIELLSHESAVLEAYFDSVGVLTWGVGITNASGHSVNRYKNNPQTLERVLEVFLWALKRYEDDVIKTFAPIKLNEHQLAAATSFHYNTGQIKKASWVQKFKAGDIVGARKAFMNYSRPKEIIPRRQKERDLFFDAKWSGETKITIWRVSANSHIIWSNPKRVDALPALNAVWGGKTTKTPTQPAKSETGPNITIDARGADSDALSRMEKSVKDQTSASKRNDKLALGFILTALLASAATFGEKFIEMIKGVFS